MPFEKFEFFLSFFNISFNILILLYFNIIYLLNRLDSDQPFRLTEMVPARLSSPITSLSLSLFFFLGWTRVNHLGWDETGPAQNHMVASPT
jgi:hypothetical protein